MARQTVNEGSTAYLPIEFRDKSGALAVPASISYRIDCATTGEAIRAPSAVTPASSIELTLTPQDNRIVTASNRAERRRVTITAAYGADDAATGDFEYDVRNLSYAP